MPRVSRRGKQKDSQKCELRYKTALYLRLSDKEKGSNVSESIRNQEQLLLDFLSQKEELQYQETYIDDGKTGTNFNRPAFQKLMEDAKCGVINCILIKDLSRFGRNYLETGNYIENVFPVWDVRLIAVNDHFDTLTASNTELTYLLPLKNLMNENYALDISKKERSAKAALRKKGYFLGSHAIYGYEKANEDKHQLIIDEEAAKVVQIIFERLEQGENDTRIAKYLNEQGIDCPARHQFKKGILHDEKYAQAGTWHRQTIARISTSEIYIGNMVQGVRKCDGIKGKKISVDKGKWDIVTGTHKAILSLEQFERVQRIRAERKQKSKVDTI